MPTDKPTSRPTDNPTDNPTDRTVPSGAETFERVASDVQSDDAVIGRAFRWSIVVIVAIGAGVGLVVLLSSHRSAAPAASVVVIDPPQRVQPEVSPPVVRFVEITEEAGIDFVHVNGATGDKLMPETMGGGCAFFDFDNDGDADLFLVNSTHWPGDAPPDVEPTMAMYRNDGRGRFEDVTEGVGLGVSFYGMGASAADFDGDGWVDLYVTAVGQNRLFRNRGGRFVDVTEDAKVSGASDAWSTASAWFDYDGDGDLDLFVGNYVRWSRAIDFEVDYRLVGVGRAYGPPTNFQATQPYLFRNQGDGSFADVTRAAGLEVVNPATGGAVAKTLGFLPIDMDRDGYVDLFVANDTTRNFFFHNNGDGTFSEMGETMGVAYDMEGLATGGMGVDGGRFRNDEEIGLVVGNFANEMTSVYVSQGDPLLFSDDAISEGIGATSRKMLTFGVFLFDYDLDGRLDLLQVNGHLEEDINLVQPSQHYEQPPQLFWNAGPDARTTYVPVAGALTGDLARPLVGRGAAYADIDGDGDLDVLVTQVGRRPSLLRNDQSLGHHWLRVRLHDGPPNRDAIGARIEARVARRTFHRTVMPYRSYLSQVELPVTFGLGVHQEVDELTVVWPDGRRQALTDVAADRLLEITRGAP